MVDTLGAASKGPTNAYAAMSDGATARSRRIRPTHSITLARANESFTAKTADVEANVNRLVEAAKSRLSGATKDKGGFCVAAMATIDTAIATTP